MIVPAKQLYILMMEPIKIVNPAIIAVLVVKPLVIIVHLVQPESIEIIMQVIIFFNI